MAFHVSEEWLRDYCKRTGQKMPSVRTNPSHDKERSTVLVDLDENNQQRLYDAEPKPRERKYGNRPTEYDGKRFDSKHEAQVYELLRLECLVGKHIGLACQVVFYLPGGVKYIADFVTQEADGTYTVYDAKSEATRKDKTYRLKRRQVKNCLGIEIQEV